MDDHRHHRSVLNFCTTKHNTGKNGAYVVYYYDKHSLFSGFVGPFDFSAAETWLENCKFIWNKDLALDGIPGVWSRGTTGVVHRRREDGTANVRAGISASVSARIVPLLNPNLILATPDEEIMD